MFPLQQLNANIPEITPEDRKAQSQRLLDTAVAVRELIIKNHAGYERIHVLEVAKCLCAAGESLAADMGNKHMAKLFSGLGHGTNIGGETGSGPAWVKAELDDDKSEKPVGKSGKKKG